MHCVDLCIALDGIMAECAMHCIGLHNVHCSVLCIVQCLHCAMFCIVQCFALCNVLHCLGLVAEADRGGVRRAAGARVVVGPPLASLLPASASSSSAAAS